MITTKKKVTHITSDRMEYDTLHEAQLHEIEVTLHKAGVEEPHIPSSAAAIIADLHRLLPILKMKARKVRSASAKSKDVKEPKLKRTSGSAVHD